MSYPKRPPHFAHKFCRVLTKAAAALEIGADACWLLTLIAHQEDAKRYRGGVNYWNQQLMGIAGINSVDRLIRIRTKAVEAGWLHYIAGGRSKAGVYWVTIPKEFQGITDSACDESGEPQESRDDSQNTTQNATANANNPRFETQTIREPSSPIPNPTPKKEKAQGFAPLLEPLPNNLKSSPEFVEGWRDWIQFRREKRNPLTPTSCRNQLAAFQRAGPAESLRAIRDSIRNGWTGVFPDGEKRNGRANSPGQVHPDDAGRAFRDADPGDAGAGSAIPAGR